MRDNWIPLLHQFNRVMEKGEEEQKWVDNVDINGTDILSLIRMQNTNMRHQIMHNEYQYQLILKNENCFLPVVFCD